MKSWEIYYGKKIFLEDVFLKCDDLVLQAVDRIKYWWSHVNFKNTKRLIAWIIINTHRLMVRIKRRFDHEQSNFFIKREHTPSKKKGSVSFFLKHVSDYKKTLREESSKRGVEN